MIYLLQVSFCWVILFMIYYLFMRKETFFSINRYYLIGSIVAGLLVPYLGTLMPDNQASEVLVGYNPTYIDFSVGASSVQPTFSIWSVIPIIYGLGVLFMSARLFLGLRQIWKHYHRGVKEKYQNITLVKSEKKHLPFSFFNIVFLSNTVKLNGDIEQILKHEIVHADQMHSLDVLFMEIIQIFFWFNPILIFYKKAIRESHEFLADAYVIKDNRAPEYRQLLMSHASSGLEAALANQFFHSQIKNRITMMYKDKSKGSALVKYLVAVPIVLIMLFSFKQANEVESTVEILENNTNDVKVTMVNDTVAPSPPPPPKASEIFGKADHEDNPLIIVDGKIVKSSDYIDKSVCSMESIKVLNKKSSIKKYGEVGKNGAYEIEGLVLGDCDDMSFIPPPPPPPPFDSLSNILGKPFNPDSPLLVIDGEIVNPENFIKSENEVWHMETLMVVDGKSAIKKYGEKGRYGAYVIYGLEIRKNVKETDSAMAEDQEVFKVIDQMPRFPGCEDMEGTDKEKKDCADKKMLEYIYSNLKYPEEAKKEGIEGLAVISFKVNTDGSLQDIAIVRNPGGGTGEAAKLVVESMNDMPDRWIPGKQDGKAVKVMYTLPVKFKLTDDKVEKENTETSEETFKIVDKMPRFPGCEDMEGTDKEKKDCADKKMLEYIYVNVKYPAEAKNEGVEGVAVIRFVVNVDGSISDIEIARNPGGGTGEAAKKVVESMNDMDQKWIPGKQDGKAVKVMYTLPVMFKLEGESTLGTKTVVIVNGKEVTGKDRNPKNVAFIELLSPEESFKRFGERGSGGAVFVTTKKNLGAEGTDHLDYKEYEVNPNPASGSVNVRIQLETDDPAELQIRTAEGKLLKKIEITNGKLDQKVAIDHVGIVYISVIQNKRAVTKKVVMQ